LSHSENIGGIAVNILKDPIIALVVFGKWVANKFYCSWRLEFLKIEKKGAVSSPTTFNYCSL